ncbi:AMP-binding protein [Acanthopleuribacter pedis]|uniref:AMP-binding protein n=1 Tax=Acanthopleuribacter pedis TaxID=442870 RepID=UPI001A9F73A4|nr:AMP-binding protein [Acanthopleuribacter pedis]
MTESYPAQRVSLEPDTTWAAFRAEVAGFMDQLPPHADHPILLAVDQPTTFAAALFACLQRGLPAVASTDLQPGTVATLTPQLSAVVTDKPSFETKRPMIRPRSGDPNRHFQPLNGNQTALYLFTSGSSGTRKMIEKKVCQLEAEIATLQKLWGSAAGNRLRLATVSHRHIYGLLFRLLWPLCVGAPFSNRTYFFWEELAAASPPEGAVVVSSPTHLHHLGAAATEPALKPDSLLFSSGGPLAQAAALAVAQNLGQAPIEVYGSTETGGIGYRRRNAGEPEPCWTPFPGIETRQDHGRLSIRSPFLNEPNNWFATDDLVERTKAGGFHLRGRGDRLVKIGEKRVSLNEIEQRLGNHEDLEKVKCLLLGEDRKQLVLAAALKEAAYLRLLQEGPRQQHQRLKRVLQDFLEPALLPKRGRYPRQLPMNSESKTPQYLLERLFAHEAVDASKPETMPIITSTQPTEHGRQFTARVPDQLIYLDGHFPQAAVVAGVVQITWIVRLIQSLTGFPPDISQMEAVKFRNLLKPGEPFTLDLIFDQGRSKWRFKITGESGLISSGRLCLRQT